MNFVIGGGDIDADLDLGFRVMTLPSFGRRPLPRNTFYPNPKPEIQNPKSKTQNPKPETRNQTPEIGKTLPLKLKP